MRKKRSKVNADFKYEILGIFYVAFGLIAMISLLGFHAGAIGLFLVKMQRVLFGIGAYLAPCVLMVIGLRYILYRKEIFYSNRFFAFIFLYFSVLAVYHHFMFGEGEEILPQSLRSGGGFIAAGSLFLFRKLFGYDGTIIFLVALTLGAFSIATKWSLGKGLLKTKEQAQKSVVSAKEKLAAARERIQEEPEEHEQEPSQNLQEDVTSVVPVLYDQEKDAKFAGKRQAEATMPFEEPSIESLELQKKTDLGVKPNVLEDTADGSVLEDPGRLNEAGQYRMPSIAVILKKVSKTTNSKITKEINEKARILESTLESFKVKAKIVHACNGPAVTRYELEPAAGVKVSKIVNLADDIALSLAAPGVRIEAPIPGKAAIGIEVPNRELSGVQLREVLESSAFGESKSKLAVGLGMDIGGQPIIADLGKMPHLLVAGATGSGKSVCINTLITSILFKANPDEVKFILIDPKMVELSNYNGIPHLMVPVVIDAKKAAAVLNWAVQEMERRYQMFANSGVRDMARYNQLADPLERMAAVVIIIDELADLMMVAPGDVEDAICRLAQKARAAGIHLVLATQRPSVDVITGIIKANIPSRISFAVSSQIDSRTILDVAGAEKLLGKGDMLYYPVGAAKPLRVQGAFISDSEVEELISFIKTQGETVINEEIVHFTENAVAKEEPKSIDHTDELLESAIQMVMETGQASASMLQRRFRIGYTRAGRLIDTMEEMRIIGPNIGSKAREILMTIDQVQRLYFNK